MFNRFTFHHVSIKTIHQIPYANGIQDSHSTMYLLKQKDEKIGADAFYIHIPPCIY